MIKSLILVALLSIVDAEIQVPFVGTYGIDDINFNLTIGTPGQKLNVKLNLADSVAHDGIDLNILNAKFYGNGFDLHKSSSFAPVECIYQNCHNGMNVTETFNINGVVLKEKPFTMYSTFDVDPINHMGILRYVPNYDGNVSTTFVESVLKQQKEHVLGLAFDNIQHVPGKYYTGQLAFGNKLPKLCKKDWAYMSELGSGLTRGMQWRFYTNAISINKSWIARPGQTYLSVGSESLILPYGAYNQTMKALGSPDYKHVPCSTKTDIIYYFGDFGEGKLRIPSEFYMVPPQKKCQKYCSVRIKISNEYPLEPLVLPVTAFSNHCLLFDYKQKAVGFTQRI